MLAENDTRGQMHHRAIVAGHNSGTGRVSRWMPEWIRLADLLRNPGAMELLKFLGWLLLNVGVPLLAPIALLPLLFASKRHRGNVGKLIRRSLQEGQLFWTVIALCASACYEAAGHVACIEDQDTSKVITSILVGWHVLIIIGSSVLVLVGAMDAVEETAKGAVQVAVEAEGNMSRIMVISIWASIIVAVSFSFTHFWAERGGC